MGHTSKQILAHLDGGIGDIIMATPCANALARAGHQVDVYVNGDVFKPIDLFRHWKLPRKVSSNPKDFEMADYDFYIMTSWVTQPLMTENIKKAIVLQGIYTKAFPPFGSQADFYLQYARTIDPNIDLTPQLSCFHSGRKFPDISKNTVVLFPGSKKEYPMKRWNKFAELAYRFNDVAVVGTQDDLWNENSVAYPALISQFLSEFLRYEGKVTKAARLFGKKYNHPQKFPAHVKNYAGQLSLADTAALISQAGLLIGNDGGISLIAAALNIPTFILFGPTESRYVDVKGSSIHKICQSLDCQPCQYGGRYPKAWRFNYIGCPIGMKCLAGIQVEDVLDAIRAADLSLQHLIK